MLYGSTRGGVKGLSFEEALRSGYCSDGGLVVPENLGSIPTLDVKTLRSTWSQLSYPALVKEILAMFIPEQEISRDTLNELIEKAFSRFSTPAVVRIEKLKEGLNIAELFHGPTKSFKDLAMSCVGQLLNHFLDVKSAHSVVLVGTSGDTGSAAIEALRGMSHADVIVLLPRDRCTAIQELQMITAVDDNVHVFRVDGTSDDLDEPIKKCFVDSEFVSTHGLLSVNSINWVRILVQTAHYFYLYLQMCPACDREVEIVVPTGAAGNVAGGCIARRMGLPIKLVCTVNSNETVARVVESGIYSINGPTKPTLASAMDIKAAYNVERLLWLFSDGNTAVVRQLMEEMESKETVKIPDDIITKMQEVIKGDTVTDANILKTMSRCWTENSYLTCPHTATAVYYHYTQLDKETKEGTTKLPRICIATASPDKFPEAIEEAEISGASSNLLENLKGLPTRYKDMELGEDWFEILRQKIESITKIRRN